MPEIYPSLRPLRKAFILAVGLSTTPYIFRHEKVIFLSSMGKKPITLGKGSYPQVAAAPSGIHTVACWEGDKGEIFYQTLAE